MKILDWLSRERVERPRSEEELLREREVEERLRALQEAADRANLERSRFLAAASHDLRQPLSALNLLAESLASRVQETGAARIVEQLRDAAGSLTEMVGNLLDLSRLDAGAVVPDVRSLPLAPLFDQMREEFTMPVRSRGLELRFVQTRASVRSDGALLRRILQNLIHNAIRYTPEGRILVGCRRRGPHRIALDVLDTGIGITEEDRSRIFHPFVQIGARRSGGREGLGLGLSIVDRSARLLGHTLEVRSVPGRGTRFSVIVPRSAAPATTRAASPIALDLAGRRILVLDDDSQVREGLRVLLGGWGYQVATAASLEEAVSAVDGSTNPFELLLVDYRLGAGCTALDVLPELERRIGLRIPAAVITAEHDVQVLDSIRGAGLPCLGKPVAPARLRTLIAHLVRRGSGLEQMGENRA